MKFPRPFSKKSVSKYYTGIDELPIYNWVQIHETGDLTHLVIEKGEDEMNLQKLWEQIYDSYLSTFGVGDDYVNEKQSEIKELKLRLDAYLTGDKTKLTFADIEKEQRESKFYKGEGTKFHESVAILEKYLGFQIDPKVMSVLKYYTHVNLLNKASKEAEAARKRIKNG